MVRIVGKPNAVLLAQRDNMDRKEYLRIYGEKYRRENKEYFSKYREEHKAETKIKWIEYYQANKEKIKGYRDKHRAENKEIIKASKDKSREKCKIKANRKARERYNRDKQRLSEKEKNRRTNDVGYKLKIYSRTRMTRVFSRLKTGKPSNTMNLLGSDIETVKKHIEKQFSIGMEWANYGKWHIDHIVPLASAKSKEDVINLFHYTNLQPLWAIDNLKKGKKSLISTAR